ncbi:family 78 glycoside hydrolase catalytic domain [Auraticoccus monumenti]|uniref:alpha-L-rhamnosidase n=1 Tax=Auraticoccus monumenti TaxID=675864 RepID=A0A1G6TZC9_9ACTN|nr:family 78 glycoside hydrolase catalytic domain [Auraticoccus monumenti]SDD34522.1 alpha-L-rhamnosidase [Auraticoccus monumenti]
MSHAWTVRFVAPDADFEGAPLLRRRIRLDQGHGAPTSAVLRWTALGVGEVWLGGRPVTADVLTPGWSSYEWRLRYAEHDVTSLLDGEETVLAVALGNGWYRAPLGWGTRTAPYGEELAVLAELTVTFADGHQQVVGSDRDWRAGPSAVTANHLYDGQSIDARRHDPRWTEVSYDDSSWAGVHEVDVDRAVLQPYVAPPVRRISERVPERVWTSPAGRTLVDFGQNLVGWVRVSVAGEAGRTVTLRHAEVLEHGELGTRPLRGALATDRFTLSGGEDVFEPTFTFHGFRYVEVDGWPGDPDGLVEGLTAVVVSSDLRRTAHFACSDELVSQLHENVVWGMRGNFLDVPTDCPQRDERLGWTGDIAAFAPTAVRLFDVQDFLRDWLRDLALEQSHHDGMVPYVVPDLIKRMPNPPDFQPVDTTAVWSDAAVWVPWAVWQAHGDPVVLAETFDSMTAHVRRVRSKLSPNGLWDTGFQFGDWLDPDAPPEDAARAKADPSVVATACAARSARLVAEAAAVLGRTEEQAELATLAEELRASFNREYVHDGRVHSDCTTVYSLAIVFDLLDAVDREAAGTRLAELVAESGFRISTGFAGTPFIADALTSTGHVEEAYRLLLQRECPSWLYPVTMGATTIWERWDSMMPDGTINVGEMTSFNHYALGAVADWLHRVVGGLAALEPGYARLLVAPRPGGGLSWAESALDTPHGRARVRWDREGDRLTVQVTVPEGTSALVQLPGAPDQELAAGTHTVTATV